MESRKQREGAAKECGVERDLGWEALEGLSGVHSGGSGQAGWEARMLLTCSFVFIFGRLVVPFGKVVTVEILFLLTPPPPN